jgi:hypothetical protein
MCSETDLEIEDVWLILAFLDALHLHSEALHLPFALVQLLLECSLLVLYFIRFKQLALQFADFRNSIRVLSLCALELHQHSTLDDGDRVCFH